MTTPPEPDGTYCTVCGYPLAFVVPANKYECPECAYLRMIVQGIARKQEAST